MSHFLSDVSIIFTVARLIRSHLRRPSVHSLVRSRRLNYPARCTLLQRTMTPYTVRLCFRSQKSAILLSRHVSSKSRAKENERTLFSKWPRSGGRVQRTRKSTPSHCRIVSQPSIFQPLQHFVRTRYIPSQRSYARALMTRHVISIAR